MKYIICLNMTLKMKYDSPLEKLNFDRGLRIFENTYFLYFINLYFIILFDIMIRTNVFYLIFNIFNY